MRRQNRDKIKVFAIFFTILLVISFSVPAELTDNQEFDPMPQKAGYETQDLNWWNESWGYRKLITWNASQLDSSLTNFPVCFNVTDANFTTANANASDFRFINWTDNSTVYTHEIEYFNVATGQIVAWINLTDCSQTKTWVYYNYTGAPDISDPHNIWSDYVFVYHMNVTGANDLYDMTGNGYVATDGNDPEDCNVCW